MATEVVLPQLGESVAEGVITRWLKQPGEAIARDEPLVEITTDKVNVELPSPVDGVVTELRASEGDTVPVEQVIAVIAESAGEQVVAQAAPLTAPAARPAAPPSMPIAPAGFTPPPPKLAPRVYSPLVRRIAQEHRLDLDHLVNTGQVIGTGENGRVTKRDLLAVLSCVTQPEAPERNIAAEPITLTPTSPLPHPELVPAASQQGPAPSPAEPGADEIVIPFTGMRKMIADHLVHSAFTAPHVTTVAQADVTRMVTYRAANREAWEHEYHLRLTYTPFFVKATADALLAFPVVNSTIQGDRILARKYVNMGVAVSLGSGGLIVPVIKNAHTKDVFEIASELEELARKARENSLLPQDVQGGTFTITNPGVFGAILSTPIIVQPQSAILGVEAIQKLVVARDDDSIAVRSMMNLCLSYDHRVIDGETAIRFLQHIRHTLEEFRFAG